MAAHTLSRLGYGSWGHLSPEPNPTPYPTRWVAVGAGVAQVWPGDDIATTDVAFDLEIPLEITEGCCTGGSHSHRPLIDRCFHGGVQPQILVADDDESIASSVRRALIYGGYGVTVARDGREALDCSRSRHFDLLILDVMMPEVDGVEVCRRVRADGDVPVLMLTARDGIADRVTGLDAGADDYLVKPFAYEELLARVRSLLRRREPGGRETLTFDDLIADVEGLEVRRGDRSVDLTALEFRLLEYFMRNPRIVLSRSRILESVWGLDADTTSNIVDVYVGYLRAKLEADGESRLLHTVRGAGYVLRAPS